MSRLPLGKLKSELLDKLLTLYKGQADSSVVLGPRIGEDAAVIDLGDRYLIAKTDPITFATEEIGWYAVHINANDVATTGARPRWFQAALLLPEASPEDLAEQIFAQMDRAMKELGVALVGGHTEITYGLDRPIVVGSMFAEIEKDKLVQKTNIQVGDEIILTKGIVIEGTAVIAREKEKGLKEDFPPEFIQRARNYLYEPGISVVEDALIAASAGACALHDPTEGGLNMGLWELATTSGKGIVLYEDQVPILLEAKALCERFGLNPFGTITSGSLLVVISAEKSAELLARYEEKGIKAAKIGEITSSGLSVKRQGKIYDLKYSEKDEITRIFE
ncbi:MAG: hypothetical protein AMS15_00525 [Planctomycetes bacterium DG_23]|nr:MAG: hypothetical protein AMS15_00525 [Planctomycetes bacterium DG_23]